MKNLDKIEEKSPSADSRYTPNTSLLSNDVFHKYNLSSPILQSPDKMVELLVRVQKSETIYNNLPWQYPISVLYTEYAAKT